jgi:hypothetical protein
MEEQMNNKKAKRLIANCLAFICEIRVQSRLSKITTILFPAECGDQRCQLLDVNHNFSDIQFSAKVE